GGGANARRPHAVVQTETRVGTALSRAFPHPTAPDATWHRKLGAFPSPVYGGGIGRGHAKRLERARTPSPPLPRKRGREQTESAALSTGYLLCGIPGWTLPRFLPGVSM